MSISIGTFNLNNLFSRYNFQAEIAALPPHEAGGIELTFSQGDVQARTFMGRLITAKKPDETAQIARRIRDMDVDVLAVQEVEHIEILRAFNRDHLGGLYRHVALIEGNDPRMIDVGLLSKLPLGPIVSHQSATHPDAPQDRVFGRDLLGVRILDARAAKPETRGQGPGPASVVWTHRFNPPGVAPPVYALFDHIWLSPALAPFLRSAHIDRRTKHGGDGSDHDPAWVVLDI